MVCELHTQPVHITHDIAEPLTFSVSLQDLSVKQPGKVACHLRNLHLLTMAVQVPQNLKDRQRPLQCLRLYVLRLQAPPDPLGSASQLLSQDLLHQLKPSVTLVTVHHPTSKIVEDFVVRLHRLAAWIEVLVTRTAVHPPIQGDESRAWR